MFPTLHYIVRWLTGWDIPLPIPTFGCCMALSFWLAWWIFTLECKRKQKLGQIPASISVPRLMDRLLLLCGLIGFAGALLLAKLEDSYNLYHHPLNWLLTYHGLNYYGGLLFGTITYLIILHKKNISLATALDIGSPGMMLAYAVGRWGCHLAGDGDWGVVASSPKPRWLGWAPDWTWAAHYPHNVLRQGVFIPGCHLDYCTVLPQGVYPTSLYEALTCLALFFLLWYLRGRLPTTARIPGAPPAPATTDHRQVLGIPGPQPAPANPSPLPASANPGPRHAPVATTHPPGPESAPATPGRPPSPQPAYSTTGLLFFIYALLTGLERFFIEFIRINPKHEFLGHALTQAQIISLILIIIGIAGIGYILATMVKKAYFYTNSVCQDPSSKKVRR